MQTHMFNERLSMSQHCRQILYQVYLTRKLNNHGIFDEFGKTEFD